MGTRFQLGQLERVRLHLHKQHAVAKPPNDPGQPSGLACEGDCEPWKPLSEDSAITLIVPASSIAQPRLDVHSCPLSRKIAQRS
jgi:hypothetical protein